MGFYSVGEKSGLVAALEGVDLEGGLSEEEQLELLEPVPLPEAPDLVPVEAPSRGRGRPAGSRNRTTEQWRRYLLGRYGSPLERLMQVAMAPTAELAEAVGLKVGDVWKEQQHAREVCARYMHQQMPQAVEVSGDTGPLLAFHVSQDTFDMIVQPRSDGGVTLEGEAVDGPQGGQDGPEGEIEQNQGVAGRSDGEV